jgi:hypothetical protein
MKFLIAMMLAAILLCCHAGKVEVMESQKIDYLITVIETLENAEFVRNGKSYDAKSAADHLRLKGRKAKSRVKTAEDFITYCASGSSMSGKPYQIRFADGRAVLVAEYLRQKLAEFEIQNRAKFP